MPPKTIEDHPFSIDQVLKVGERILRRSLGWAKRERAKLIGGSMEPEGGLPGEDINRLTRIEAYVQEALSSLPAGRVARLAALRAHVETVAKLSGEQEIHAD